jgi:hypothetical protein
VSKTEGFTVPDSPGVPAVIVRRMRVPSLVSAVNSPIRSEFLDRQGRPKVERRAL